MFFSLYQVETHGNEVIRGFSTDHPDPWWIRRADSTLPKACVLVDLPLLSLESTVDGYSGVVHSKVVFLIEFFRFLS